VRQHAAHRRRDAGHTEPLGRQLPLRRREVARTDDAAVGTVLAALRRDGGPPGPPRALPDTGGTPGAPPGDARGARATLRDPSARRVGRDPARLRVHLGSVAEPDGARRRSPGTGERLSARVAGGPGTGPPVCQTGPAPRHAPPPPPSRP